MHITEKMTICGLSELPPDKSAGITHLLSILDPGYACKSCLISLELKILLRGIVLIFSLDIGCIKTQSRGDTA